MIQHLLAITLAATSCQANASSPATTAGSQISVVELRLDRPTPHEDFELRWLEVHDSRCPTGAQCVWQGEVKIEIEAVHPQDGSLSVELTLSAGRDPQTARVFGHELRLESVEPHPKSGIEVDHDLYRARIEISAP